MAVYFEPRRPSWMDYVAPVVGQLLGGVINQGFEKNREIRAAKQAQDAANAEALRKQQENDWILERLGLTPGGLDMRGDPNAAMYQLAAIKRLVPDFDTTGALGNLNPNFQFQSFNTGDRTHAGAFDPATGQTHLQAYQHGTNPTTKYSEDAATKRNSATVGASYAGIAQRDRETAARERIAEKQLEAGKAADWYPDIDSETGERIIINKMTGEVRRPGTKPPQKAPLSEMAPRDLAGLRKQYVDFDNTPLPGYEDAVRQIDEILAEKMKGTRAPAPPTSQVPGSPAPNAEMEAQIQAMMKETGGSREEVVAYLRSRGLL